MAGSKPYRFLRAIRRNHSWVPLLLLMAVGLRYLPLAGEAMNSGWDAPGHYHLAKEYAQYLQEDFRSRGWDDQWFRGYPAFSFYPPLLYFLSTMAGLLLPGVSAGDVAAFNLVLWAVLLYLAWSLYRTAVVFLSPQGNDSSGDQLRGVPVSSLFISLLSATSVLLYLSFPGAGLHGVSAIGFLDGTYGGALGLALLLSSIRHLEEYRRYGRKVSYVRHLLSATLLFYAHYLSTFFYGMILVFYLIFFFRDLRRWVIPASVGIPPVLSLPVLYPLMVHGEWSQAAAVLESYPVFLSILGTDILRAAVNQEASLSFLLHSFFFELRLVQIIAMLLYMYGLFKSFRDLDFPASVRFLFLLSVPLWILTQDESSVILFGDSGVHIYRIFDVSYAIFSILVAATLFRLLSTPHRNRTSSSSQEPYRSISVVIVASLIGAQFLLFDPWKHEQPHITKFNDARNRTHAMLRGYLQTLPSDSLVFYEKVRKAMPTGSPHSMDLWLEEANLRNAGGLMIESSISANLLMQRAIGALRQYFVWGQSPEWLKRHILSPDLSPGRRRELFLSFLEDTGTNYVITVTPEGRSLFLNARGHSFKLIRKIPPYSLFRVEAARPRAWTGRAVGALDARIFVDGTVDSAALMSDFYRFASLFQARTGVLAGSVVNLNSDYRSSLEGIGSSTRNRKNMPGESSAGILSGLDALVVYDLSSGKRTAGPTPHIPESWFGRGFAPIVFVNLTPGPGERDRISTLHLSLENNMRDGRDLDKPLPAVIQGILEKKDSIPVAHSFQSSAAGRIELSGIPPDNGNGRGCTWVFVQDSFFPEWRSEEGQAIYPSGSNGMALCTATPSVELQFAQPFARVLTVAMMLLILLQGSASIWALITPERNDNH